MGAYTQYCFISNAFISNSTQFLVVFKEPVLKFWIIRNKLGNKEQALEYILNLDTNSQNNS